MNQGALPLKVFEAYTRDVGKGVARIDYDSMASLGVAAGDILEIRVTAGLLPNVCHFILQTREKTSLG